MMSVYGANPQMITEQLGLARKLTAGPIGANFIMRAVEPEDAHACVAAAAASARVVEFFYSEPDPVLGEQLSERPVVGVGPGVVGHDPLWLDAQRSIPVKRSADEGGDGVGALVGVQLGVGDARVVVDD